MTIEIDVDKLAQWIVIGYKRSMSVSDVACAAGCGGVDFELIHDKAAFFPSNHFVAKTPIRAFVAANWPKLNEYLLRNEGNPEKMLSIVHQIKKLRLVDGGAKGEGGIKKQDRARGYAQTKRNAAESKSYELSRGAQKSHQRGAWDVCK